MKQFYIELLKDFLTEAVKYAVIPALIFLGFYTLINYIFG